MVKAQIYFDHIIDTGCGFGIRTDDGHQVFIPAKIVRASGAKEHDILDATLVPNKHPSSGSIPWMAIFITKTTTVDEIAPPPAPALTLDERIYKTVADMAVVTTAEAASEVGVDGISAHNALLRLFKTGRVVKADVYANHNQERASFCMWALQAKDFLGESCDGPEIPS